MPIPGRLFLARWFLCLWAVLVAFPALAGEVLVDMLDIGQGDSVLVRGGGKTVLIDAGIPASRVVEQLQALGVTRLDLVVASHPHADHIGDMQKVVESFEVGMYMDNGLPHTTVTYQELMKAIEQRAIPYRAAKTGQVIKLGEEASFTVLWPGDTPLRDTRSDLNSNSVVMLLTHGENTFLFTGDAEEPTEQTLISGGLGQVDVLKVPHHGSEHSSTEPFLDTVHPSIALISCGAGNRYGHPDPIALARYAGRGIHVYRTDLLGHIRVVSDGKKLSVVEGILPEFRGLAARSTSGGGRPVADISAPKTGTASGPLVLEAPSDQPAKSAEEMGVNLSGAIAPNPIFDDLDPDARGRKGKKDEDEED